MLKKIINYILDKKKNDLETIFSLMKKYEIEIYEKRKLKITRKSYDYTCLEVDKVKEINNRLRGIKV